MKNYTNPFLFNISLIILLFSNSCSSQPLSMQYKDIDHESYYPETIEKLSEDHYFITFEKAYFGKLELTLYSEKEDTIVVKLGEKAIHDHSVDINPPGTVRSLTDTLFLTKGKHTYQVNIPDFVPPAWGKGKHYNIFLPESVGNLIPFRYVEIENYTEDLKKNQIKQKAFFYPFNESASLCKTSSEELNQVWNLCKHSIKATSFTGIYIDGDRERRPYEGDTYINQLSHYAVDAEYALTRKTIDHLFKFPTWPTEWPLHMHMVLWEDYMYTGNTEYLQLYYDDLKQIIKCLPLNDAGLIVNHKKHDIIDWPLSERDHYELSEVNNVPNAFYNNSLQLQARIAGVLNKESDSIAFAQKAEQHKLAFNKYFLDEKSALYTDATDSQHSSLHSNIFPVVFHLVPDSLIENIAAFVKTKGMAASVYGAQYLLDALYMMEESGYALQLMTADNDRSWLHMIASGGTITWEAWNEKAKPNLDWNHAWGTAPANVIARRLFGIRPLEPGFKKAGIQPQFGSLDKGRYIQPTLEGPVKLIFYHENESTLILETETQMPAQLILSQKEYDTAQITLNKKILIPELHNGQMIIELSKGKNQITLVNKKN